MSTEVSDVDRMPGMVRYENLGRHGLVALATAMTWPSYAHDMVYGRFCTVHEYIDCPADVVYDYLTDVDRLVEWTVSTRDLVPTGAPGRYVGVDRLADDTPIHFAVRADPAARTVDYHCAWDQGDDLWMVYLLRLVDAGQVLGRPGTVVIWTNCRHRNYDHNPHPELAPAPDRLWVGDLWPLFYAGHTLELANLKIVLERRYAASPAGGVRR